MYVCMCVCMYVCIRERGTEFLQNRIQVRVKPDALRSTEYRRYQSRVTADSCFKFNRMFQEVFGFHKYGFWYNISTLDRYLRLSFGENSSTVG
jgi:hypothetical protein